jgi:hypothetical protein
MMVWMLVGVLIAFFNSPLPDLLAADFVKLLIGFGSPLDVVHGLLYKL